MMLKRQPRLFEDFKASFDFTIKNDCGAYTTSTVRGHRASCTHSREEAAKRLAAKVFGADASRLEKLGDGPGAQLWRAWR